MCSLLYDFFRDQGSIIAGLLALIAGVFAYNAGRVQARETRNAAVLQIEAAQRKDDREVGIFRKSLAIELRQVVPIALEVHNSLAKVVSRSRENGSKITARMVEYSLATRTPVVYHGNAYKIGILENDGLDVMIIYNLIEDAQERANQLLRYRTPDDISLAVVAASAQYFLIACQYAQSVLPKMKTGFAQSDDKDPGFFKKIDDAVKSWADVVQQIKETGS